VTREQAIAMSETGWWEDLPDSAVVAFQLFESRLCMPFSEFHKRLEGCLGRPVFTHEMASSNIQHLYDEFRGLRPKATIQEIMNLIPENKRIIIVSEADNAE